MEPAVKYLSHCAALFQLFGHFFFSVKYLTPETQKKFPSLAYTIYFLVNFVALTGQMVIFTSLASSEDIAVSLAPKSFVNYLVQHSMFIGLTVIICVALVQSFIATPLTKKLFLNFINIARMCKKEFHYDIDYKAIRKQIFGNFFIIVLFFIISQLLIYSIDKSKGEPNAFFKACCAIMPLIFMHTTAFKFFFLVKMANYHLEIINQLIIKTFSSSWDAFESLNIDFKPIRLNKSSVDLTKRIKNIRRIYNVLHETTEIINQTMGLTVLTMFFVMVIVLTASGYRLFLTAVDKAPVEKAGWVIFALILSFSLLICIVYICHQTGKKVSSLAVLR